ncbi:MAG: hypothetical protein Kow0027_13940 [Saprospiraceae bacterium]|jgi:DNA-binding transcriptional ArsR family regulator
MKNTRRNNTCIRTCRDEAQIYRCQQELAEMGSELERFAETLKLTGNAVRMKILLMLAKEQRLCVCDMAEILKMTVPAVSQHLKKLREGGLVHPEPDGVTIYYQLSETARPLLHALFEWIPVHGRQVSHQLAAQGS